MGSTPGYEPARERDGEGLADMPPPPSGYSPHGARAHTPGPGIPAEQFPDSGKLHSYAEVSHLGKGSFGDTWKAYDRNLRKYVAIKIFYMRPSSIGTKAFFLTPAIVRKLGAKVAGDVQEAVEECVAVKRLMTSSNAAYYPGSHNMCQCFQETCERRPALRAHLPGAGALRKEPERAAPRKAQLGLAQAEIITQILQGVDFLQANGLIHHDLKPDNVCVTDRNVVKIIDFGGLQNFFGKQKSCAHTPAYAPPELLKENHCYDMRGPVYAYDGYATGLMLMEFMCGTLTGLRPGRSNPCTYGIVYGAEDVNARFVAKMLTQVTTTERMSPQRAVAYLLSPQPTTAYDRNGYT
ncbi:unnamed protein product [Effrenium voratum]|uniref:non-specific serine/threonine protein kinase n=1 Tax=Effrenium voratum TaxID=2562239 RepID=A0AA36NH09_9DINO|nr:unnamed protein product [Effrenium voratum]